MTPTEVKRQWSNVAYILNAVRKEDPRTLWCMALRTIFQAANPLWTVTIPMQIIRLLEASAAPRALFLALCRIALITVALQIAATWADKRYEARISLVRTGIFRVKMINKLLAMKYSAYAYGENRAVIDRAWMSAWSNNFGVEGALRGATLFFASAFTLAGMAIALWRFSPLLPLLLLLFSIADQRLIRRNNRAQLSHREEDMALGSRIQYIHETLQDTSYGKEVRVTGLGRYMSQWHANLMAAKLSVFEKVRRECAAGDIWLLALSVARMALIYGYLIYGVWRGQTTIADFSMYFAAGLSFSGLVVQLIQRYESTLRDSAASGDIQTMLALPDDDAAGEPAASLADGEIAFRDVSYQYPNAAKPAVDRFSYTFAPGASVAIVGENGSGKTTLVKLLCGLIAPTEGVILSGGEDMARCAGAPRYRQFSVVFQEINQYALTLGENVAMESPYDGERVREVLREAGLDPDAFPRGLDTTLRKDFDPEGVDLSGGQLQALAIARALYRADSRMLIMDEPTAALDPIAERRLYSQLHDMARGRTAIFISHRLASTRFCDEILVMKDGRLAEVGTHDALMAQKGHYYRLFDAQSEFYRSKDLGEGAAV